MTTFVSVDQVDKVFPLAGGNEYVALKGINLDIKKGEFISLLHSAGSSTEEIIFLTGRTEEAQDMCL